jgi:alpha-L-fucosidase
MTAWFARARFGMFVHWGAFSLHGWEPSWPLVGGVGCFPHCADITVDDYYRDQASFDPAPGAAREWMRLARRCGMRYAVLTTKHHDGFALFRSVHADYGVAQARCGRDLVAEFVDAARAEGVRVGLYFSLPDWRHPDYPAWRDDMRPYAFIANPRATPEAWERFTHVLRTQLTHLLTAYGPIDLLWFDGGWERTPEEWRSAEIEALVRRLQPALLVNDRLPGVAGDFATPEQSVPGEPPAGAWETCMTLGRSWGNPAGDLERKSGFDLVRVLAEVAGKGGNLMLNVSPDGAGRVPAWQRERLEAVADWLERHGAAVFDTTPGLAGWQFYGPTTRRDAHVYLFCVMRPHESVEVRGVPVRRVRQVRALGSGRALATRPRLAASEELFASDPHGTLLIEVPPEAVDPLVTVLEVTFAP